MEIEAVRDLLIFFVVDPLILHRLPCSVAFIFEVRLDELPDGKWHALQGLTSQGSHIKIGLL